MFPAARVVSSRPCRRCRRLVRADRLVRGFGRDCAELLGLTGRSEHAGQDGPDLFAALDADPEDCCDGWDRPADRRPG